MKKTNTRDTISRIITETDERIEELKPAAREYETLVKAREALAQAGVHKKRGRPRK